MTFRYERVLTLPETLNPNEILFRKAAGDVRVFLSDKLGSNRFPMSEQITLQGPTSIVDGESAVYQITSYSSARSYTVTTSDGAISRTDDSITFTPSITVPGNASFEVNGQSFTIFVDELQIVQPMVTSPVDGAEEVNPQNVVLTTSDFQLNSNSAFDTHVATDWEVATDPEFTNIVFSSYEDSENKTSIVIP